MGGREGGRGREGEREREHAYYNSQISCIISTELNVEGSSVSFAMTTA
jgi:hypothetical protein